MQHQRNALHFYNVLAITGVIICVAVGNRKLVLETIMFVPLGRSGGNLLQQV